MPPVCLVGCDAQAAQADFEAEVQVCGVMPSKNGSRSSSPLSARSAAPPSTGPTGDHPTTKRFTAAQSFATIRRHDARPDRARADVPRRRLLLRPLRACVARWSRRRALGAPPWAGGLEEGGDRLAHVV